jgi:hypothetical protein
MAKGNMIVVIGGIALVAILALVVYQVFYNTGQTQVVVNPNPNLGLTGSGTSGQNPSISLVVTDAITGATIGGATAVNYQDSATLGLLGSGYSGVQGQTVIPLLTNTTGFIPRIQSAYTVIGGAQILPGTLYKFANESILISSSTGTGNVGAMGGTLGTTGNDTKFTTLKNINLQLTGNTYKSSGDLFIIFETNATVNVQAATLSQNGVAVPTMTVSNCYSNNVGGTPFRAAWEVPAVIGGNQANYVLQVTALNGNTVQGLAYLTVISEKDFVDTLTSKFVTSGYCDSNGATDQSYSSQVNAWYYK